MILSNNTKSPPVIFSLSSSIFKMEIPFSGVPLRTMNMLGNILELFRDKTLSNLLRIILKQNWKIH